MSIENVVRCVAVRSERVMSCASSRPARDGTMSDRTKSADDQ